MTQTCLFYWCIGCIGQIYRAAVQVANGAVDGPIYECHLCGPRSKMPSVACMACIHLAGVIPPRIRKGKISALNTLLAQDFPCAE